MSPPNPQPDILGLIDRVGRASNSALATNNMSDAVSRDGLEDHPIDERRFTEPEILLYRCLGHIPVNPGKHLNTFLLKEAYVWAEGAPDRLKRGPVINKNEKVARKFLQEMVDASHNERELSLRRAETVSNTIKSEGNRLRARQRFFVMLGARGIGKTFFLNHILSANSALLDDKKTVWVRLNLPLNRAFDHDLDHWGAAQATKILLRYYDPKSRNCHKKAEACIQIASHLSQWCQTLPEEQQAAVQAQVDRLIGTFCEDDKDLEISPALCPAKVCEEAYLFARRQGFAFVVIFDGFDRLDVDRDNSHRFLLLREGLERLVGATARVGCTYLLVSRTETFESLQSVNPYAWKQQAAVYALAAPSLVDIVDQRLEAVISWGQLQTSLPEGAKSYGELESLANSFDQFLKDMTTKDEWSLEELDDVLIRNTRAKVQMVQVRFIEFIGRTPKGRRHGYRLIEYLTGAGRDFPPMIYDYKLLRDGTVSAMITERTGFDTRFLPVVFRCPAPQDDDDRLLTKDFLLPTSILHGVRILQILMELRLLSRRYGMELQIEISDMVEICCNWFGYNDDITRTLIYEFEAFELIRIKREYHVGGRSDNEELVIAPKGERLITSMIPSIAYLNLAAMRTLFDVTFLKSGLIVCESPPRGPDRVLPRNIRAWILAKIRNSIILYGFVRKVNSDQRDAMSEYVGTNLRHSIEHEMIDSGIHNAMFENIDRWGNSIASEIKRMTDTAIQDHIISEGDIDSLLSNIESSLAGLALPLRQMQINPDSR